MTDSVEKLSELFLTIQDAALEMHEHLEKEGSVPLLDFERLIFSGRQISDEARSRILWQFLLFTQARIKSQSDFQASFSLKISSPDAAFIVHQLHCTPPRIWSYRQSYQRGFAHTIAGPDKNNEISVDSCLSLTGLQYTENHLYLYGWTLSYENRTFLVSAETFSQKQAFELEGIRPFPLQLNDDDFWEENLTEILNVIYAAESRRLAVPMPETERTEYAPERRYARLKKFLSVSQLGVQSRSLQEIAAVSEPNEIVSTIEVMVKRQTPTILPTEYARLNHRMLEAIGCDDDGNMPHAHPSLLMSDPMALLLLPEDCPIYRHFQARDSIRQVLAHADCTDEVRQAFETYQHERRWLAAFPCFDLSVESHAVIFGIPTDAIRRIFSPKLWNAHLPIVPQGDVLKQLQTRYQLYLPDQEMPEFGKVLEILTSRGFSRSNNMSQIARWIVSCCERYRYCLSDIEPDLTTAHRSVDQNNQKLLKKGLMDIAKMFKKS